MDRTSGIDSEEDQLQPGGSEGADILRLLSAYAGESLRIAEVWSTANGIHHTDARALLVLDEATRSGVSMTAGRLAAALGLSSPATSALISRLEASGHLLRTHDPADRRRVQVALSPSASHSAGECLQPIGEAVRSVLSECTDEDQRMIADFLQNLVEHMRDIPRK